MPRKIPQPPQRRHTQRKMVPRRIRSPCIAACRAGQSLGQHLQAHPRKVLPNQCRTENCVKNMLYSRMRKSVRQLNRFVHNRFRKELKPIKISFINRLIEVTESAYKQPENERNEQQIKAISNCCIIQI